MGCKPNIVSPSKYFWRLKKIFINDEHLLIPCVKVFEMFLDCYYYCCICKYFNLWGAKTWTLSKILCKISVKKQCHWVSSSFCYFMVIEMLLCLCTKTEKLVNSVCCCYAFPLLQHKKTQFPYGSKRYVRQLKGNALLLYGKVKESHMVAEDLFYIVITAW